MRVVGVTGTKGKTTTCFLLRSILEAAGLRVAVFTSVEDQFDGVTAPHSRPNPRDLDTARAKGYDVAVVEATASALGKGYYDSVRFDVGVFTNLSPDHLNVFGTMDAYLQAKARLFRDSAVAILNDDDAAVRMLRVPGWIVRFSTGDTDVQVKVKAMNLDGMELELWLNNEPVWVKTKLTGLYNAYNVAAAAAAASALGVSNLKIAIGIEDALPVPGRFERVDAGQPFPVIVDFAHNPASLRAVLALARTLVKGKVVLVLHCRLQDRTRIQPMIEIAHELADTVYLTGDPARGEHAQLVAAQTWAQAWDKNELIVDANRRRLIEGALAGAGPDDIVLMTGRGDHWRPYTDADVARNWLRIRYSSS